MSFRNARIGLRSLRVREPNLILQTKARVKIHSYSQLRAKDLTSNGVDHRLGLDLHGCSRLAPVPGQLCGVALPAQESRGMLALDRRISHQVHALGVTAG